MPIVGDQFQPGAKVEQSGVYQVIHANGHTQNHEVTCLYDKAFPRCNHCGDNVRFVFVRGAQRIEHNRNFTLPSSYRKKGAAAD